MFMHTSYCISIELLILNRSLYIISLNMFECSMQCIDQHSLSLDLTLRLLLTIGQGQETVQGISFCNSHRFPKMHEIWMEKTSNYHVKYSCFCQLWPNIRRKMHVFLVFRNKRETLIEISNRISCIEMCEYGISVLTNCVYRVQRFVANIYLFIAIWESVSHNVVRSAMLDRCQIDETLIKISLRFTDLTLSIIFWGKICL